MNVAIVLNLQSRKKQKKWKYRKRHKNLSKSFSIRKSYHMDSCYSSNRLFCTHPRFGSFYLSKAVILYFLGWKQSDANPSMNPLLELLWMIPKEWWFFFGSCELKEVFQLFNWINKQTNYKKCENNNKIFRSFLIVFWHWFQCGLFGKILWNGFSVFKMKSKPKS